MGLPSRDPDRIARKRSSAVVRSIALPAALLMLTGCAGPNEVGPGAAAGGTGTVAQILTPTALISGARVSSGVDSTGTPLLRSEGLGFQRFVHPVSVAGHGPDTYIADVGLGAVYRFDSRFDTMAAVPGVRARIDTKLQVGGDATLYVVDPASRQVLHFARNGQPLGAFRDDANLARPVDVAEDPARARVLVADGMFGHLVAFHPVGRASYVVSLRGNESKGVFGIAAIAVGAEGIYVADPICRCIARTSSDGTVLETFGHQELSQPGPIAVDGFERVFVVDRFDGSLKIFARGRLFTRVRPEELRLQAITDVWIHDVWLALADGRGAHVEVLQLSPPPAER